jgi:hypothetical protein
MAYAGHVNYSNPPQTLETAPATMSEVDRECTRICNASARVASLITALESRLASVLRTSDTKNATAVPEEVCYSGLGNTLRSLSHNVESHEARLETLLGLLCI